MGDSFEQCRSIEASSREILHPFIEQRALNGQYVTTDKGRLAKSLQKTVGDVLMNRADGRIVALEIKAEAENKTNNLFLEIWSNLSRYTVGWMFTLDCDVLLYHFIASDELYVASFAQLRNWAFREPNGGRIGRIWHYPLRCQSKREQLNDTWGACVPISVLREQAGVQLFHPIALAELERAA